MLFSKNKKSTKFCEFFFPEEWLQSVKTCHSKLSTGTFTMLGFWDFFCALVKINPFDITFLCIGEDFVGNYCKKEKEKVINTSIKLSFSQE